MQNWLWYLRRSYLGIASDPISGWGATIVSCRELHSTILYLILYVRSDKRMSELWYSFDISVINSKRVRLRNTCKIMNADDTSVENNFEINDHATLFKIYAISHDLWIHMVIHSLNCCMTSMWGTRRVMYYLVLSQAQQGRCCTSFHQAFMIWHIQNQMGSHPENLLKHKANSLREMVRKVLKESQNSKYFNSKATWYGEYYREREWYVW